jgi:hypothetical protein
MLDELALELERDGECGSNFRSKVLTPVLQRQIHGIPNTYAPSARSALMNLQGSITITDATMFYLGEDPLDPKNIPTFRRNLIYSREARWHLSLFCGKGYTDILTYTRTLTNQEELIKLFKTEKGEDHNTVTSFSHEEMVIVVSEGIEGFFKEEFENQVCVECYPSSIASIYAPHSLRCSMI